MASALGGYLYMGVISLPQLSKQISANSHYGGHGPEQPGAADHPTPSVTADDALGHLETGNERFANSKVKCTPEPYKTLSARCPPRGRE